MRINFKQTAAGTKRIEFYVDESGQDTQGRLFIVAAVVVARESTEALRSHCESVESSSRKGRVKWASAERKRRLAYLRTATSDTAFGITVFYSVFRQTTDYHGATIVGVARAIRGLSVSNVSIFVDGLTKPKCNEYKTDLRQLGCSVKKVRGIRKDENEPLIRLADAVAGAAAELIKYGSEDLGEIFSQAKQQGTIVEL